MNIRDGLPEYSYFLICIILLGILNNNTEKRQPESRGKSDLPAGWLVSPNESNGQVLDCFHKIDSEINSE